VSPGFYLQNENSQNKKTPMPTYNENSQNKKTSMPTYSEVFGEWLCDVAEQDTHLIGITPAMSEGSGMMNFLKRFPERYFDVGIAEQHSLTFAAGLACEGKKPVDAIYSTFLQRAYDQLIHDIALQNLDVTFAIDRAGLVGADGPTHAGTFDLSFMRCIPNMVIMAPSDANECRQMLTTAYHYKGPAAVRYPRGSSPEIQIEKNLLSIPFGKGCFCRYGEKISILAFGSLVPAAIKAGEKLNATVVNMRFIKPLDEELIKKLAATHELLVTVEENAVQGGAGSAVNEFLAQQDITIPILNLGLPDQFLEHGIPKEMLAACGLDSEGITRSIQTKMQKLSTNVLCVIE
jgi:1-deoxy-D-xylulose-5-phosphate synthase